MFSFLDRGLFQNQKNQGHNRSHKKQISINISWQMITADWQYLKLSKSSVNRISQVHIKSKYSTLRSFRLWNTFNSQPLSSAKIYWSKFAFFKPHGQINTSVFESKTPERPLYRPLFTVRLGSRMTKKTSHNTEKSMTSEMNFLKGHYRISFNIYFVFI